MSIPQVRMTEVISFKRLILFHPSGYTLYLIMQMPEVNRPLPGAFPKGCGGFTLAFLVSDIHDLSLSRHRIDERYGIPDS